jgi:hypothetical protein
MRNNRDRQKNTGARAWKRLPRRPHESGGQRSCTLPSVKRTDHGGVCAEMLQMQHCLADICQKPGSLMQPDVFVRNPLEVGAAAG